SRPQERAAGLACAAASSVRGSAPPASQARRSSRAHSASPPRPSAVVADPVVVPAGTTCADAVAAAGLPTTGPQAVVVVRDVSAGPDGPLRDLSWTPEVDTPVLPVPIDSPGGLAVLRHSTAHVLAQA